MVTNSHLIPDKFASIALAHGEPMADRSGDVDYEGPPPQPGMPAIRQAILNPRTTATTTMSSL